MRKLFLLLVFLSFLLQVRLQSQVKLSVELQADGSTYLVKLRPDVSYMGALNMTNNAQVSFTIPTGGFRPDSVKSINGLWTESNSIVAPSDNPSMDYFLFTLQSNTSDINYVTGEEVELFSFKNTGICTGTLAFVEEGDPFLPPNSQSVNIGNQITVLGAGLTNAFDGTYGEPANCLIAAGISIDSVRLTAPSDCGLADGSISIFATHEEGNTLQYSVDGGDSWNDASIFSDLQAGISYDIQVRDSLATDTVEYGVEMLAVPKVAMIGNTAVVTPTCNDSTGSIEIEATNLLNDSTLQFSIDGGETFQDSSGVFQNLSAGTYNPIIKTTGSTCIDTLAPILLIDNPCPGEGGAMGGNSDTLGFTFTETTTCPIAFVLDAKDSVFTISLISDTTLQLPGNTTSTAQIAIKVPTGNFEVGSLTNLIDGVVFSDNSRSNAPAEEPNFDYISFGLDTRGTRGIIYEKNRKVPLFSFKNTGACTGGAVSLIDNNSDPFINNSSNINVNQQITVAGTGIDTEICVSSLDISDCGIENKPVEPTCDKVNLGEDINICEGDSIQLNPITTGGTFTWMTTGNISCTDCQQPTIRPRETTNYIVTNVASEDCTTSDTIRIIVAKRPLIDTILQVAPNSCVPNGSITIRVVEESLDLRYSIDNGENFVTTPSFSELENGNYQIQVTNSANCMLSAPRMVTLEGGGVPIEIDSVLITNPNDCKEEVGRIMAMVTLQDSIIAEYSIDSGATWVTRADFDELSEGTFHLLVRTADSSCVINYENNPIQLMQPDTARIITGLNDRSFCQGETNSIRVVLNQAIDGFTIEGGQFMNADTNGDTLTFMPVFEADTATYSVMLTGDSGCSSSGNINIFTIDCSEISSCGFFNGLDTLRAELMEEGAMVCLPVSNMDIEEFQFIQDGEIIEMTIGECNNASIFYSFNTASLGAPPFLLQEWIVNGDTLKDFEFNTAEELVARMNEFDQEANWVITDDSGFIGIASDNTYGPLKVLHIGSNTALELQLNNMNIFFQSLMLEGVGTQIFILRDTMSNCQDTLTIKIDDSVDTLMPPSGMDTLRLMTEVNTALIDQCLTMEGVSPDSLTIGECGEAINGFILLQNEPCFNYTPNPDFIGQDTFCLTLCSPSNCDTTFVILSITPSGTNEMQLIPIMDTINLQTTINKPLTNQCLTNPSTIIDSLSLMDCGAPANGIIMFRDNSCFDYIPDPDFMGADSFCLVLCSPTECDTAFVRVNIIDQGEDLIIPNGFSPNDDTVNDFFVIENINNFPDNELKIFNRWGNLVYEQTNYQNEWNGTFETEIILPDGIYFYVLTLPSTSDVQRRSGYLVLRR